MSLIVYAGLFFFELLRKGPAALSSEDLFLDWVFPLLLHVAEYDLAEALPMGSNPDLEPLLGSSNRDIINLIASRTLATITAHSNIAVANTLATDNSRRHHFPPF